MKFNKVILYKVPFDNIYKNVVDYHLYNKSGATLSKLPLTKLGIRNVQNSFFEQCAPFICYDDNENYHSIKVTGRAFTVNLYGSYEQICDYNYLILTNTEIGSQLFGFVISIDSSNDSANPSCVVTCEIDYWNQYVDEILLNTPLQYEEFAHESCEIYNGKLDKRLPKDFIYHKDYTLAHDSYIMFLKVKYDNKNVKIDKIIESAMYYQLDPTDTAYSTVYIPFACIKKGTNGTISFDPIYGVYATDYNSSNLNELQYFDFADKIQSNGFFNEFDSQNLLDASFTVFTPFGILDKSYVNVRTTNYGEHYLFNVSKIETGIFNAYFGYACKFYINNYEQLGILANKTDVSGCYGMLWIGSKILHQLPTANSPVELDISFTDTQNRNVLSIYDPFTEKKLYQYPYNLFSLRLFGEEYNLTPEPSGTSVKNGLHLEFLRSFNVLIRVTSGTNLGDTGVFVATDSGSLPTSIDKLNQYKETSMGSDVMKMVGAEIGGIGAIVGGAITGNIPAIIGGSLAVASAPITYGANYMKISKQPNSYSFSALNAFDNFYEITPIICTSNLKQEDLMAISSIWCKNGYPINEIRAFTMRRFWYDYKQLNNSSLPNITNAIARKTLEQIFNDGVTIWHCSSVNGIARFAGINNYTLNNPDNTNCTEVG